jgi:hypothetical protein
MRIPVLLTLVAVVMASACGGSNSGSIEPKRSGGASEDVHASQASLVYAAVIRQLVTKDHGFGGAASPYRHVYVLDGVVPTAGDPMHLVVRPAKPFADGLSQQIAAELGALPPVSFVRSRRLAITGAKPGDGAAAGHVLHRGVLITLGRIHWVDARTATVANNRWASGLNGQWLSYTVKLDHSVWRVAGVSGNKVAIS